MLLCVLQRALLSQNFTACTRAALSAAHGIGYVADGAWRIALSLFGARPPFAVAVNGEFVARGQHAVRALQAGDKVDVVQPVAGG